METFGAQRVENRCGIPSFVMEGRLSLNMKRKMSRMARKETEAQANSIALTYFSLSPPHLLFTSAPPPVMAPRLPSAYLDLLYRHVLVRYHGVLEHVA